jgi:hypothetical protein
MLGFHSHEGRAGGRKVFTFLEIRDQVAEVRYQRSEIRGQITERRCQILDGRDQLD